MYSSEKYMRSFERTFSRCLNRQVYQLPKIELLYQIMVSSINSIFPLTFLNSLRAKAGKENRKRLLVPKNC